MSAQTAACRCGCYCHRRQKPDRLTDVLSYAIVGMAAAVPIVLFSLLIWRVFFA